MNSFANLKVVFFVLSSFITLTAQTVFADYEYDANGNVTFDEQFTYEYNDRGKLSVVKQGSTIVAKYFYDHTGRRIKKVENGEICYYVSSTYQSCDDGDSSHYFIGSDRVAQKNADGSKTFYHTDHIGSAIAYSDGNGAVTKRIEYEPFGSVAKELSTSLGYSRPIYSFSGKEKDSTGNLYFEARYLNPSVARFGEVDPIRPSNFSPTLFQNPYQYGLNNPFSYGDSTGQAPSYFQNKVGKLVLDELSSINHAAEQCINAIGEHTHTRSIFDGDFHRSRDFENTQFLNENGLTARKDVTISEIETAGHYGMKRAGPFENFFIKEELKITTI